MYLRKACELLTFICLCATARLAHAGSDFDSIQDILQKTEFSSGFRAATCADQLATEISDREFYALSSDAKMRSVHLVTNRIYGTIANRNAFGGEFAQREAGVLANHLHIMALTEDLRSYREELVAVSWELGALLPFAKVMSDQTVHGLIAFQAQVAALPRPTGKLPEARAAMELGIYTNLGNLYDAQLRGSKPLSAIMNLDRTLAMAINVGADNGGKAYDVTGPALRFTATALDALSRVDRGDRSSYVRATESFFESLERLIDVTLKDNSEMGRVQKTKLRRQISLLYDNPNLAGFPHVQKSIQTYMQSMNPPHRSL